MYHGIGNVQEEVRKCSYCKKLFLIHEDSIKYRHWNISGYYEIYDLCSTGKGSCYANFLEEYVNASSGEDEITIYVVNQ